MRLMSWNVNGLRAVVKKGFTDQIDGLAPDVLGLQETKAQDDQVREALFGWDSYQVFSSSAVKKGYSGTAVLTKHEPLDVQAGIGVASLDQEGRVLRLEFEAFHFVTVYTPNSSSGLKRLPFRGEWDAAFRDYLRDLDCPQTCGLLRRPQCGACAHRFGQATGELQQNPGLHPARNRWDDIPARCRVCGHLAACPPR